MLSKISQTLNAPRDNNFNYILSTRLKKQVEVRNAITFRGDLQCRKNKIFAESALGIIGKLRDKLGHKIIVISGPSGVGKDSMIRQIQSKNPRIKMVISHTTRAPRSGEKDGVDYYFVSKNSFENMLRNNAFAQHTEFDGKYYGASFEEFSTKLRRNDVMVVMLPDKSQAVKKAYGKKVIRIYVDASEDEVLNRLKQRQSETPETLSKRVEENRFQARFKNDFDRIIENHNLDSAVNDTLSYIESRKSFVQKLLDKAIDYLKSS